MPMKNTPFRGPVFFRYVVLQILGLIAFVMVLLFVRQWLFGFPLWLFWLLIAVWIAKDAALYPLVWRAYDAQGGRDPGPYAGTTGVARQRLEPSGYIEVCGELWRAELTGSAKAVEAGRTVKVTGREGLTLFVEPEDHHQ